MGLMILVILIGLTGVGLTIYLVFFGAKEELSHDQLKPKPSVSQTQFIRLGPPTDAREQWSVGSIFDTFYDMKNTIYGVNLSNEQPGKIEGLKSYFGYLIELGKMIVSDKEIVTFALLQWASIAVGYYLWVQILAWIPAEVWRNAQQSRHASFPDLILILWSFVCVGLAALPIGIFSACIGVVYFLRRQGYPASIASCLRIVLPEAWPLWIFTWADGWTTVWQILERLPKKHDRETPAEKALSEALYFAWKLGTIGLLPALITGRGFVESCRDSIAVVRTNFMDAVKLRLGYSLLCWIVGISAYVGTVFFFNYWHFVPPHAEIYGDIYKFYFYAGVPILIAVGFIELILRPAYIIGSCELYAQYLTEHNQNIMLPHPPSKNVSAFVFFIVLCLLMAIVFLFKDSLGISPALSGTWNIFMNIGGGLLIISVGLSLLFLIPRRGKFRRTKEIYKSPEEYGIVIPQTEFMRIGPEGYVVIEQLIKNDILVKVNPVYVAIKPKVVVHESDIRTVAGNNFEVIWDIFQRYQK